MNRKVALSRRQFLRVAGTVPMGVLPQRPRARASAKVRLGLILKMKRDLETDWRRTLARVAALGVKDVEFPGTLGPSAVECRHALDDLGLTALGGGAVFKELDANLDEIIATSQVLGKKYVYCYWPWLDGGKGKTGDDWKRLADTMNKLGTRAKSGGLKLAYHNHDMEFERLAQGPFPYDLLLQHTDPSLMTMQMDLFWVDKARVSPVPFLKRHPGRVASFHIKERGNTPEGSMLCSGASFTNLNATLKAGVSSGVRHFVIENEDDRDHYGCVAKTISYMKSLGF